MDTRRYPPISVIAIRSDIIRDTSYLIYSYYFVEFDNIVRDYRICILSKNAMHCGVLKMFEKRKPTAHSQYLNADNTFALSKHKQYLHQWRFINQSTRSRSLSPWIIYRE